MPWDRAGSCRLTLASQKPWGVGGRGTRWEIDLEGFFSASFLSDNLAGKMFSGFAFTYSFQETAF